MHGVNGVVSAYQTILQTVSLSGPTNFADIIRITAQHAKPGSKQHYVIMLIITDGEISDLNETISEIIDASYLPMSIVIVGVGAANFTKMDFLDSDNNLLQRNGKKAARDIVQFVPYRDFKNTPAKLAEATLKEIPEQVVGYFKQKGIKPNPPPAPVFDPSRDFASVMPGSGFPNQPLPGQFAPQGQFPPQGQYPSQFAPPGQFPGQFQGQFPPGQYPQQGQFPPGQYPPQFMPPGQYNNQFPGQGQFPPGQYPQQGQFPPQGQYPPQFLPPGQSQFFPQGQFPPGQYPQQGQGQFPPGQYPPQMGGQYPPQQGAPQPGQVRDAQTFAGQPDPQGGQYPPQSGAPQGYPPQPAGVQYPPQPAQVPQSSPQLQEIHGTTYSQPTQAGLPPPPNTPPATSS